MQNLRSLERVGFVRCLFRDFGVPFCKPTLFLRNTPYLHRLAEGVLAWGGKTIPLRGTVEWEGQTVFKTHLAQTYPPFLGTKFAGLVSLALSVKASRVARDPEIEGALLPGALLEAEQRGLTIEQVNPVPFGLGALPGLSPLQHVEFGVEVLHPSECPAPLNSDLQEAIQFECGNSVEEIDDFRQELLARMIRQHSSNGKWSG